MPRKTTFRPLAAADEAPQPRHVDHALDLAAAAAAAADAADAQRIKADAEGILEDCSRLTRLVEQGCLAD